MIGANELEPTAVLPSPGTLTAPRSARRPGVVTDPPGPRAAELIARDARVLSPSLTRPYPLVVDRAAGLWVTDVDGNEFLDFTAGIAVTATGHAHPAVVAAVEAQARRFLHMAGTDFYYEPEIALAARLAETAPVRQPARVFLTNSGAEAVEGAMKLARWATGRSHFLAFTGAFHGRTLGALSLTASKSLQRDGFGPLLPGVFHVPFPSASPGGTSTDETFARIDDLFRTVAGPRSVAAAFVEPIQGEGGYVVPPDDFLPRLRDLTREHGILLVVDEIQTGVGRTGRLFALEHSRVVADVVTLAKGLASGMPLGAFVAGDGIMTWPPGSHGSTFGGNPVSCAAALATLALVEDGLLDNVRARGRELRRGLVRLRERHPALLTDVRGRGLMLAVECAAPECAAAVIESAFRRGLLTLSAGERAIRFSPALTVSRDEVAVALEILDEACREQEEGR
jgi:4-aminobutyrate aminotransferase